MITGTSTLRPDESDNFWWYSDGQLVEVQLNGGAWLPTVRGDDPNGKAGHSLRTRGPETSGPGLVLLYGVNRFKVRVDNGVPHDGGSVYVGQPGQWADPYDPFVYSTIVNGVGKPDATVPQPVPLQVLTALAVATSIVDGLTRGAIHPAGVAVDDFRAVGTLRRLAVNVRPLVAVEAVERVTFGGAATAVDQATWMVRGSAVLIEQRVCSGFGARLPEPCGPDVAAVQVRYRFGSTISAAARQALLVLAHQFYRRGQGLACELPERTTSVTREGVSIQITDAQEFLDLGRTGVSVVDQWLVTVTPGGAARALGRAAVYAADAPPPVTVSYRVDS